MTSLRRVDDSISVAPQIAAEDIPLLAEQGFGFVINNRPDEEEMGQPAGDAIRAAAEAAGLGYGRGQGPGARLLPLGYALLQPLGAG
jgi:uncharacterized protein (TIGR01244 family)